MFLLDCEWQNLRISKVAKLSRGPALRESGKIMNYDHKGHFIWEHVFGMN